MVSVYKIYPLPTWSICIFASQVSPTEGESISLDLLCIFLSNLTISNFRLDCLTYLHLTLNIIINIISYIYISHFTFVFLVSCLFIPMFLLLLYFALNGNFLMLLLNFFNDYLYYIYISHFLSYIYISFLVISFFHVCSRASIHTVTVKLEFMLTSVRYRNVILT